MPGACTASIGSGAMGSALAVPVTPKSSAAVEPTATAALANSVRVDDIVLPGLEVVWLLRRHGRALRTPAGSRPAAAGAAARGAAAAGAAAAGAVRPGSESPVGSSWARPAVLLSGAGSAEVSDDSAFTGAAAEPATGAAAGAAAEAGADGSVGTSGRVSDAVAPGGGVAGAAAGAAVPDIADARVCISCGAAEPMDPSEVNSWVPGLTGAGATGSAAAVPLSASAEAAPAAAIMVETSSFRVRFMVLPIVGRRRPEAEASLLLV